MTPQAPPPGWYPHPRDWSLERYWNGSSWEDRYRRVPVADPVADESPQTPSNDQQNDEPDSVRRLPGYASLSSLLTKRAAPPKEPADPNGSRAGDDRNGWILLGISVAGLAILGIGEGLGLFPDETTASTTSAAAPSASTPSPTSTPSVTEPAPTATGDTESAAGVIAAELVFLQSGWRQISRPAREALCTNYALADDKGWSSFHEQVDIPISKEAYLTFFGTRC
jgi:hypothetical protein